MLAYLRVDVGLLSDFFQEWRKILMDKYKLDIIRYVSLAGYAYDAFLKNTETVLDLIHDPELCKLIQGNIRGGLTTVVKPLHIAKNHRVDSNFDGGQSSYITYLDFNSLYPTVMCKPMPLSDIEKMTDTEMKKFLDVGIENHEVEGEYGYWIYCDMKPIRPDVARKTDELPLTLTHKIIEHEDLSPYNQDYLFMENRKNPKKNKKLVASHEEHKLVLHTLKFLQLLLDLGAEVDKVHAVYRYKQTKYLEPFIQGNVEARKNSISKYKQSAFKCISNSIFGKTLLNPLKRNEKTHIVTTQSNFLKKVRSPFFKRYIKLKENRAIVISAAEEILLNHPQQIGFTILEFAKYELYYFFYKVLKPHYGNKAQLLYSDTDSYVIALYVDDIDAEYGKYPLKDYMDTSNFDKNHPLYSVTNKGKLGLLKSESGSKIIKEFCGLKPKMYSILIQDDTTCMSAKGVSFNEQTKLTHNTFKEVLEYNKKHYFIQNTITNRKGQMSTVQVNKKGLGLYDDKRYYIDRYTSLGYAHPDVVKEKRENAVKEEEEQEEPLDMTQVGYAEHLNDSIWTDREIKVKRDFKERTNKPVKRCINYDKLHPHKRLCK